MKLRHPAALLATSLAFAACGMRNDVHGTVQGEAFEASAAQWDSLPDRVGVTLTDRGDFCEDLANGVRRRDARFVNLTFFISDGRSGIEGQPTPGEYSVEAAPGQEGTREVAAFIDRADGACQVEDVLGLEPSAVSGWARIDKLDPGSTQDVTGSFDLTFDNGDHVSGRFQAERCPPASPKPLVCK